MYIIKKKMTIFKYNIEEFMGTLLLKQMKGLH